MPLDRKSGHIPEGCQVLCVSHWGVQATSESHVDVEAHTRPCAHLCKGEKHLSGPGLSTWWPAAELGVLLMGVSLVPATLAH